MRKRLLIAVVVIAGLLLLFVVAKSVRRKGTARAKSTTGDTTSLGRGTRRSRKARGDTLDAKGAKSQRASRSLRGAKGKRGTLQGMTPEQVVAERKRLRAEKRRLRQELSRRRREERLAQRAMRSRGRRRGGGGRSLYDAYTLKGTSPGLYALIGTRRLERGDVIAGKKLVEIGSSYIVLEQFGNRSTVRLGEPVERSVGSRTKRRS